GSKSRSLAQKRPATTDAVLSIVGRRRRRQRRHDGRTVGHQCPAGFPGQTQCPVPPTAELRIGHPFNLPDPGDPQGLLVEKFTGFVEKPIRIALIILASAYETDITAYLQRLCCERGP